MWYAVKIVVGALICWFALPIFGLHDPYWAVISICLASDPDVQMARKLAFARLINTLLGGTIGLTGVMIGGITPLTMFVCLGLTTFAVTTIPKYPPNWRLAPATVVIIMEVAVLEGKTRAMEIHIAEQRVIQVAAGCAVALLLAWIVSAVRQTKFFVSRSPARVD